jgi:hypothetical protein
LHALLALCPFGHPIVCGASAAPHIESYRLAWTAILAKALSPQRSAEFIAKEAATVARQSEKQR